MNDRELLELAAKAAGYGDGLYGELSGDAPVLYFQSVGLWDPLGDDGDALRLAVNLEIDMTFCYPGAVRAEWGQISEAYGLGDDPYAATRRAIVRAAAEIGALATPP